MATAAPNEAESITKCPICFETYNLPKYLPCLHTLCETCLSQYITSVFETNKSVSKEEGFPCPICRRDVPISDSHLSPKDIAAKLPGNHFMVTLLDQSRLKSKNKLCDPCSVLEKHNQAESWCTVCNEALCTSCHQYHKAMKVLQNHKICSLEEMQSEAKTITTLESCTQHEEEKVKLYCMDHQQPCCPICVTVHHRKCDHVKTLNDAAKGIRDSPEIQELTKSLKTMKDELSTVLKGRKSNLQQLKKGKQQYQDKITKMRQDINKQLDLLEKQVNQELGGRYKEASALIGNDIDDIESCLKAVSHYQNVIDAIVKNVSDVHMFLEMNRIKQQHRQRTGLLKKRLEEMKHHEVELRFEDGWVNLITHLTKVGTVTSSSTPLDVRLGSLDLTKVGTVTSSSTPLDVRPGILDLTKVGTVTSSSTPLDVRPGILDLTKVGTVTSSSTPLDVRPGILDLTKVGTVTSSSTPLDVRPGILDLTKVGTVTSSSTPLDVRPGSFDLTKVGTVTSSSTPHDVRPGIFGGDRKTNLQNFTARKICNFSTGKYLTDGIFLPNDRVLLVDTDGRRVIFCNLNGRVQKQLSLSGYPWSIVQLDDREAAVVLYDTQNIQLINLVYCTLGKLITVNKTLYKAIGYNGTNLIVGGTDNNIYMIDRTGNIIKTIASGYRAQHITCTTDRIYLTTCKQLVCLDMNGSLIFSYTNSNFNGGQGTSVDREGNIYCCGLYSHNIHQLTPDGQFIKLIVTDIIDPCCISFDKTGERFLVTQSSNNVTVYELRQCV